MVNPLGGRPVLVGTVRSDKHLIGSHLESLLRVLRFNCGLGRNLEKVELIKGTVSWAHHIQSHWLESRREAVSTTEAGHTRDYDYAIATPKA